MKGMKWFRIIGTILLLMPLMIMNMWLYVILVLLGELVMICIALLSGDERYYANFKLMIPIYNIPLVLSFVLEDIIKSIQEKKKSTPPKQESKNMKMCKEILIKFDGSWHNYQDKYTNSVEDILKNMDKPYHCWESLYRDFEMLCRNFINSETKGTSDLFINMLETVHTIVCTNDTLSPRIEKELFLLIKEYETTLDKIIENYEYLKNKERKEKEELHESIALPRMENIHNMLKDIQKDCNKNLKRHQGENND